MATKPTTTVHLVLHDANCSGPAADGTVIARFKDLKAAERFARSNTCYGRPATVQTDEVPRRIAQRWCYAG